MYEKIAKFVAGAVQLMAAIIITMIVVMTVIYAIDFAIMPMLISISQQATQVNWLFLGKIVIMTTAFLVGFALLSTATVRKCRTIGK